MDSLRHIGHLPGFLNFSLFLNTKPHFRHSAGVTLKISSPLLSVLCICSRCSYISFSETLTLPDSSFAESVLSLRHVIIICLIVSFLSIGSEGSLGLFFEF